MSPVLHGRVKRRASNARASTVATRITRASGVAAGSGSAPWNDYIADLAPWAWLKLDDAPGGTTAADASGNGRNGSYPNGTFGGGDVYPNRQAAALLDGSVYGIITGGGNNNELIGTAYANVLTNSWTFGMVIDTTSTTAAQYLMGNGSFQFSVSLNWDFVAFTAAAGAISLTYDTSGTNANGLTATTTGFNDGNPHLLMFEYDHVNDTLSIWKDGVEIATRTRAGTKPSLGSIDLYLLRANPIAGMGMDEVLFFDKILTTLQHTTLAGYVA